MEELNRDALRRAADTIRIDLGSLTDLPDELANTIVNIYYRACELLLHDNRPDALPRAVKQSGDIEDGMREHIASLGALTKQEAIPKMIAALRSVDRHHQPNLYAMTYNFVLDVLKYEIKNASNKPEIWRRVERLFRRGLVKEIPRLTDQLPK